MCKWRWFMQCCGVRWQAMSVSIGRSFLLDGWFNNNAKVLRSFAKNTGTNT